MMETTPILAGIVYRMREPVDDLIDRVRSELTGEGIKIGGVRQDSAWDEQHQRKTLVVREINGAWEVPILQFRGKEARGCRLDPFAITDLSQRLDSLFQSEMDLMIVNRFGRAESESRGLRDVFERAALDRIPLLVAVREDYCEAWRNFHDGMGVELALEKDAVLSWWRALAAQAETRTATA